MTRYNHLILMIAAICVPAAAQAQMTFQSSSSDSQTSFQTNADGTATFKFRNARLGDVLNAFGVGSSVAFDATMDKAIGSKITYGGKDMPIKAAFQSILDAAKLRLVETKDGYVLTATKAGEKLVEPVRTIQAIVLERKLSQPSRLMMRHTPLNMVIEFASGMSQLDIQIDRVALRKAGINPQTMVSIDSGSDSLGESLEKMLRPHGLKLEIVEDMVVVTTIKQNSPTFR